MRYKLPRTSFSILKLFAPSRWVFDSRPQFAWPIVGSFGSGTNVLHPRHLLRSAQHAPTKGPLVAFLPLEDPNLGSFAALHETFSCRPIPTPSPSLEKPTQLFANRPFRCLNSKEPSTLFRL